MHNLSNHTLSITSQGHGKPLILLHGWGFSSQIWTPLIPLLTHHYRVICIDLPGHGQSLWTPLCNDLNHVIENLVRFTPPNAIWLGWSLGGLLALAVLQKHPEHVKQLLLVASTPKFVESEDWPHGITKEVIAGFAERLHANTTATLARFITLQNLGSPHARQETRALSQYIQHPPNTAGLDWGLNLLNTLDLRSVLKNTEKSIHCLFGPKDSLVPLALADYLLENYPHIKTHVLAQAAHMPFFSHPNEFILWLHDVTQ